MEFQEAITKAMGNSKVTTLKDYFLASIFSITEEGKGITEWTLLFYNKQTHKIVDCFVNDKFVTLDQEMPAQKEMERLEAPENAIEVEKAIEIAKKNYSKKTINILISLHMAPHLMWTITMIGSDISATKFDIDAKSGKIVKEETTSLMKKI